MTSPDPRDIERLLDMVEEQEMTSLSWGHVDGSVPYDDVLENAARAVGEDGAEDLIETMIERGLLFETRGGRSIRSRFGEAVRLLARLRQLFPGRPWETAPHLVSDFRIDQRPRRYPRRELDPMEVLTRLPGLSQHQRAVWQALTQVEGRPLSLAQFQADAACRILGGQGGDGTIITAGTGSGKTLAFYLPALTRIVPLLSDGSSWTKILALYPRSELLKDQFAEAYRMARRLDRHLPPGRILTVGALFAATPRSKDAQSLEDAGWEKGRSGWGCPFIACPICGGVLSWRNEDIAADRYLLACSRSGCDGRVSGDQVPLTRERLRKNPPDLLFTTTEMVNRRMSDSWLCHLFGIGVPAPRRPRLLLLDEVHTYVGTSGAQAAMVLRRWRHAVGTPVVCVGLSATLLEAERFFRDLAGLNEGQVAEVTPSPGEMVEEGAEYQLVLRGDPVSQTSLLSTTIQTIMLLGRVMDTREGPSGGLFGSRVFVFTDDLDITNRLFDNTRDAEAYDIFGRPDGERTPLAALRVGDGDGRRDAQGQRWKACEEIGRALERRLGVSRTHSHDRGVDENSDVVIATAALEVGYNDNRVGCVIQHKAPRDASAFLQRKGRAGRKRGMRPWTVTILSDYGRDRFAYQSYEMLFDPRLPPQTLPIGNQYLLRMQAAMTLIDWLAARRPKGQPGGWLWDCLSGPSRTDTAVRVVKWTLELLARLMKGESETLADLRDFLCQALRVTDDMADSLLWEPPRALMTEVLPTLVRRLHADFRLAQPSGEDGEFDTFVPWHPLPEFIPSSLFGDLSLPEIRIVVPPATSRHTERVETMPVIQALNQFAPGRISRRFAHERGSLHHWIPIDDTGGTCGIAIGQFAEQHAYIGHFTARGRSYPVYWPWTIRLAKVEDRSILPTSNAAMNWMAEFVPRGEPIVLPEPRRTRWQNIVPRAAFYLHAFRASIGVRRFAHSATANLRRRRSQSTVTVAFTDADGDAAIGFETDVDGILFSYEIPSASTLATAELSPGLRATCRTAFFRWLVLNDPEMPPDAGVFLLDWVQQIYLSALMVSAHRGGLSLRQACDALHADEGDAAFAEVMEAIFSIAPDDGDDEAGDSASPRADPEFRLRERLGILLRDASVLKRLRHHADGLWQDEPEWGPWLRRRLHETVAQALLQACVQSAPAHASLDTLVGDTEPLAEGDERATVLVTELTLGGAGVVQSLAESFVREPRAMFRALEAALAPGDREHTSLALDRLLAIVCEGGAETSAMATLRAAEHPREIEAARRNLAEILGRRGIRMTHELSVAVGTRLMRQGMDAHSDRLLHDLIVHWNGLEARWRVAIDLRVFCFLAAADPAFAPRIRTLVRSAEAFVTDLVGILAGILWPRPGEFRQRALISHNPFRSAASVDTGLVRELLTRDIGDPVSVDTPDWMTRLGTALSRDGVCRLTAPHGGESSLRGALLELLASPIDVGFLQLYPAVERFERDENGIAVVLGLREDL
jgi:hypothetical protein